MISTLGRLQKFIITLIMGLVGGYYPIIAQDTINYEGPLQLNYIQGNARYKLLKEKKDSLLHGVFSFKSTKEIESPDQPNQPVQIEGNFVRNLPSGLWKFNYGDYRPGTQTKLEDFRYVTQLSGSNTRLEGNFKGGNPIGEWTIEVDSIEGSSVVDTVFRAVVNYNDKTPQKIFTINTPQYIFAGRSGQGGLAQDIWELYSTQEFIGSLENWKFEKGILLEIQKITNKDTLSFPIFSGQPARLTDIELDERFLNILQIKFPSLDTTGILNRGVAKLLLSTGTFLSQTENLLQGLATQAHLPFVKVRVETYPLSKIEEKQFNEIRILTQRANALANAILENAHLNVVKLSDQETAKLFSHTQKIDSLILRPLNQLDSYYDNAVVPYTSRKELLSYAMPVELLDEIKALINQEREKPYLTTDREQKTDLQPEELSLKTILELAEYSLNRLTFVQKELGAQLEVDAQKLPYVSEEKQLVEETNRLRKLIDSLNRDLPKNIASTLDTLNAFVAKRLRDFAKMEDVNKKKQRAEELTACFTSTETLALAISEIPVKSAVLRQLYTIEVLNPFTATLMDEDVKKRLMEAYSDILIPYYLKEVEQGLACNVIDTFSQKFGHLYKTMQELREKDTERMERRLKRLEDPEAVIELMGISKLN